MGIACAFDVVLVKQRLGSARCEYMGLSDNVAPPRVLEQLSYHLMHLVLCVEGPYHENQLVLTQSVRECPLQLLGNSVQRLVSTTPVGAIAMYTANLNSLAPETLKKCSCLLSYHFLLVRCQNVYFDGSHLENPIGPPIVSAIVIHISELGSLVPKPPEKWSCLLFYNYLLARNVKMSFLMAAILNRPIWRPY